MTEAECFDGPGHVYGRDGTQRVRPSGDRFLVEELVVINLRCIKCGAVAKESLWPAIRAATPEEIRAYLETQV